MIALWITLHKYKFVDNSVNSLRHKVLQLLETAQEFKSNCTAITNLLVCFFSKKIITSFSSLTIIIIKDNLHSFSNLYGNESFTINRASSGNENLFLKLSSTQIAEQLTLLSHELLCKIEPKEWPSLGWIKKDESGNLLGPNIFNFIEWFNLESQLVAVSIITENLFDQRTQLIIKFIDIANKCLELQNFSSSMAIYSALSSAPVQRLKSSWRGVPLTSWKLFNNFESFFSMQQNFARCRDQMRTVNPPCVPHVGILTKDITFNEENPSFLENGNINFFKFAMVGSIVNRVSLFQSKKYSFERNDSFVQFLKNIKIVSDEELWNLSMTKESKSQKEFGNDNSSQEIYNAVLLIGNSLTSMEEDPIVNNAQNIKSKDQVQVREKKRNVKAKKKLTKSYDSLSKIVVNSNRDRVPHNQSFDQDPLDLGRLESLLQLADLSLSSSQSSPVRSPHQSNSNIISGATGIRKPLPFLSPPNSHPALNTISNQAKHQLKHSNSSYDTSLADLLETMESMESMSSDTQSKSNISINNNNNNNNSANNNIEVDGEVEMRDIPVRVKSPRSPRSTNPNSSFSKTLRSNFLTESGVLEGIAQNNNNNNGGNNVNIVNNDEEVKAEELLNVLLEMIDDSGQQ